MHEITTQPISVSIPAKFFRSSETQPYLEFLRKAYEIGVRAVDARLWDEDSKKLLYGLATNAEVFLGPRTPMEFTVSRRSYLKCVFIAKEHQISFYDLSFWLVTYGASSIRARVPSFSPLQHGSSQAAY